jgi:hypothetical protein
MPHCKPLSVPGMYYPKIVTLFAIMLTILFPDAVTFSFVSYSGIDTFTISSGIASISYNSECPEDYL